MSKLGGDSQRVFYQSRVDRYLYSVSIDDPTDRKRLRRCQGLYPVVSPDGKYVAVPYRRTLEIVDLAKGSTVARWVAPANLSTLSPNWSPDGKRLCVSEFRGPLGLWEFNLETKEAKKLLAGFIVLATWSPDGHLAIASRWPRGIWIARAQDIGEGQTLEEHYQEVVRWTSRRIEAKFPLWNNRSRRAEAYLGLKETAKAMADLEWLDQQQKGSSSLARRYNAIAWRLIAGPEELRNTELALRLVRKAFKLQRFNPDIYNTMGVAQYRSGQYKQALMILQTTDGAHQLQHPGGIPRDVAFIAMAQYQLGYHEEAKKSLERLRALMKESQFAGDPEAQRLLREAEELFGR